MTQMQQETHAIPEVIAHALSENSEPLARLCAILHERKPPFVATIARGSSDHAATFAKYAFETHMGLMTASFAPSVHTLYNANVQLKNAFVIAISQSGESPDIIETLNYARQQGATTCAFVNQVKSPLAGHAEFVIPLQAGTEKSVAATKSFVAALVAIAQFTAIFCKDRDLLSALQKLAMRTTESLTLDWHAAIEIYLAKSDTLVLGRGFSFAAAQEAALKFKETSGIHAEAFSSAEVMHGPLTLIKKHYPLLLFTQQDETLNDTLRLAERFKQLGAEPLLILPRTQKSEKGIMTLPMPPYLHPLCDPITAITAFYKMIVELALQRGYNPDQPENLNKVTKTR